MVWSFSLHLISVDGLSEYAGRTYCVERNQGECSLTRFSAKACSLYDDLCPNSRTKFSLSWFPFYLNVSDFRSVQFRRYSSYVCSFCVMDLTWRYVIGTYSDSIDFPPGTIQRLTIFGQKSSQQSSVKRCLSLVSISYAQTEDNLTQTQRLLRRELLVFTRCFLNNRLLWCEIFQKKCYRFRATIIWDKKKVLFG